MIGGRTSMGIRQLREKNLYYTQIGEELGIDPQAALWRG